MSLNEWLVITIGAILVNNMVLARILGICPFLGVSKKLSTALGMSGALIFVMTLASFAASVLYNCLISVKHSVPALGLQNVDISFTRILLFIVVIAALVQLVEIIMQKFSPTLYGALGIYLPLITTNCCVLGVAILVVDDYGADVATLGFGAAFIEALVCAVGSGVGFMLAMCLFSGVRKRVELCDAPGPFKGLPITLVAAAITSLSFMGFGGIVENLFNVTL